MIHLVEIGPDNWRTGLRVSESQRRFVSDEFQLLARAYAYRAQRSRAFLICDDEMPVGMGLYHDLPEWECYDFSQLFIDERYQGRGCGKAATQLVLNELRRDGRYRKVILCYIEGNDAARNLYEQFGFVQTDRDEDEIIMELDLER
jgi:diamine N-acetyltransferase